MGRFVGGHFKKYNLQQRMTLECSDLDGFFATGIAQRQLKFVDPWVPQSSLTGPKLEEIMDVYIWYRFWWIWVLFTLVVLGGGACLWIFRAKVFSCCTKEPGFS